MTIKVKATAADFIGRGEYINDYAAGKYGLSAAWFYTEDGESVHRDKLFSLSNEEQRRIIRSYAAREYDSAPVPPRFGDRTDRRAAERKAE